MIAHDLVKAILQHPTAPVLHKLVDLARQTSFNGAGRHASAYILQRLLHLGEPPVDPISGRPMTSRRAKSLHRYIDRNYE